MILIAYNPNFIAPENIRKLNELDGNVKELIIVIPHYSKTALPIYICDGRIEGIKNETNLPNNNETKA